MRRFESCRGHHLETGVELGQRIDVRSVFVPMRKTRAVRRQYHFWPGVDGLDAWDVDRLIELSASFVEEEVSVRAIWELDTVYWFDESQPATVRAVIDHIRLIEEVDVSFPIILGPDGRVMDGMHRVARAILDGRDMVNAVRFTELPDPDFRNCHPDELPYDSSC